MSATRRRKPRKPSTVSKRTGKVKRGRQGEGGGRKPVKLDRLRIAKVLARLGATDAQIGEAFGISGIAVFNLRHRHPEVGKALKLGKREADEAVIKSLYQRATGYSHPDVDIKSYEGRIIKTDIVKHYPPDTTACIFWLKNRQPDEWRERQELVGEGGGPLMVVVKSSVDPEAVTGPAPAK